MSESGDVWQERDTTPERVAAALRELLKQRHAETEAFVPARVLNLVVIVDRDWRGEIQNRLDKVGSYHASRTILVSVEEGRDTIDASAAMTAEEELERGELAVAREHVVLDIGPKHLKALDTIVDPLVVSDLATLVWSPHRHHEGVDAMAKLAQVILIDSENTEGPQYAVRRSSELAQRHYVVDLSWLRSTPWRERVASTFDPGRWRGDLASVAAVTVRHKPDSAMAGYLLLGWLASRLGWEPGPMTEHKDGAAGKAKARKHEIKLALEADQSMTTPGLAGITVESARGMRISLDRGPGGLAAHRVTPDGQDHTWTVTGASRGESGILGEGIRQALLRDHTYAPSLAAAERMLG